ncbi:SGNH/GDSL hydrolase family protein [Lelliottia amnigena]|jgi:lysophospholipase L1-like esterase|uniref:SGNH/GDSL hydrolase family protein n=1 Tax=Lelliottia amnigena TaxID=61646 RepID=UPI001F231F85|nr:SGNH/GDSL hydrolase family protein [Lelliottia amnigena]MCE9967154.1 SGNH/GDSL hydrolase family protein [Lelliottia amnigena]
MKGRKAITILLACIVALVVVFFCRRELLSYQKHSRIENFQSVMMDFKKMNIDQSDGDYIIFGDSLIQGMNPYSLDVKFVNMGVGGYTIGQIRSLLMSTDTSKYKKIFLEGGVNDALSQSTGDEIGNSINKLLDDLTDKHVVLLQIIPVNESTRKDFSEVNKKITTINNITSSHCNSLEKCEVVPVPDGFAQSKDGVYMDDGVHLKKLGYQLWVTEIKKSITINSKD